MRKLFVMTILSMSLLTINGFAKSTTTEAPFTVPTVKAWKGTTGTSVITSDAQIIKTDANLEAAANYLSNSLKTIGAPTGKCSVFLKIVNNKKLGQEGYIINIKPGTITIQGKTPTAVMWGIQTILQLAEQNINLPCGQITDEPDYALRGFMIDCARKFIPMDYLRNLVKTMSYYKMNTLQVHLNDNGFKKYFHQNWDETYAAFRLESERFPELTARDGHYTKAEFRDFVKESARLGVEIIPEIDVPAHSLAFTHFRPSLGCEEFGVDHLDLTNPRVVPFIDSLFVEYLEGPDPVFAGPRVHCGTDEYSNKKQDVVELFRGLTDHLIKLIESYGKQPKIWGSLTYAKGETPVQVKNVIMDMWSNGFADPNEMHKAGYQMVSIPDGYVYIVPAAGYYYDYLNDKFLYERWTPANVNGVKFQEKDPQIVGGMFAVWNDVCGNGISVGDVHHRTFPALQTISQKCWHAVNDTIGYQNWNQNRKAIHEGPGVNELGHTTADIPTLYANSTINNDYAQIGYDYQVDFDIVWGKESRGTILTQGARAEFYLSDPISGMLGYSRDGYLFTFNYSCRPGVKEHITIKGTNKYTQLSVNGKVIQTLGYDERIAADKKPYNVVRTLVFPLHKTGNFHSSITNFVAKKL